MTEDLETRRAEALAKLEALRENFGRRLVERVEELSVAVEAAADHADGTREVAKSLAHKLSGTAGSYGFPAVSAAAGELELLLAEAGHDVAQAERLVGALRDGLRT